MIYKFMFDRKIIARLSFGLLFTLVACGKPTTEVAPSEAPANTPTIVHEIHRCSRLYTTEYKVYKVVTLNDVKRIKMKVLTQEIEQKLPGVRKVAVPISVTFKAYIDMEELTENAIQRTDSSLTIFLPDPHVLRTASKVEHERIKEYTDLVRDRFSEEEIMALAKEGEIAATKDIAQTGILESARRSAANTLLPLLQRLGYPKERVRIVFRKEQFSPKELQRMITIANDKKR